MESFFDEKGQSLKEKIELWSFSSPDTCFSVMDHPVSQAVGRTSTEKTASIQRSHTSKRPAADVERNRAAT